jgi:tetratricopeptide (TPR) repeat protein
MGKGLEAGLALVVTLLAVACGSGSVPTIYQIDTPNYHVRTGNKMLGFYKIDSALREFDRAIELDPKFSPAHIGQGLAYAHMGDFVAGLDALDRADRFARGKDQEVAAMVGYMRFYGIAGDKYDPDWLKKVEDAFSEAILIADGFPAPYYYMGLAYKASGNLDEAAKRFYRVLEMGKGYVREADREYAAIEKRK